MRLLHPGPERARKFVDPDVTIDGQPRASVELRALTTLWFNTGTLCNLTCGHCYIESSPHNDRLSYLTLEEVERYLDEVEQLGLPTREIGFTGGEPFLNPDIVDLLHASLARGYRTLVLTNATRPMLKVGDALRDLNERYPRQLVVRVSLDHYLPERHEEERGKRTWAPTLRALEWLNEAGIRLHVAGRLRWGDEESAMREGYTQLFAAHGIVLDDEPVALVLFPEMDAIVDVPEITTACWGILEKNPDDVMCASSRMIVHRKGEAGARVVSCTLLPYDERFDLGPTLSGAADSVKLNHPHCAKFCVLGGGKCSV